MDIWIVLPTIQNQSGLILDMTQFQKIEKWGNPKLKRGKPEIQFSDHLDKKPR